MKRADGAFQELYSRFESGNAEPGTIEAAALLLDHVISRFQESYYRPHLERTVQLLTASLDPARADLLGHDALQALSRALEKIRELVPESTRETIKAAAQTVHASLAKRHLAAGDEEGARTHLEFASRADIPAEIETMRRDIESAAPKPGSGTLFIPLVQQPLKSLPSLIGGRMIRGELEIEMTGEWSILHRRKPVVAFGGKILESQGPFALQLRAAADAADHIFIHDNGQRELARLPRQYLYSFSGPGADTARAYTGGSAGLGFALLTLDKLDALGFRRRQRRLKGRIAVTGYLGPEGSVLPVDNAGIAEKLKTVFFSACTHFVIPEENRAAAARALERLNEEFPARRLELVTVASVEEAYRDDRIFQPAQVQAGSVALRKMGRRRKYLVAASALLIAAVVMLLLIPPIFTKEISRFYVEKDVLYFVNRFGVVFDTFTPGYHIYKCENKEPGLPPGLVLHKKDSPPAYAYNGFIEDVVAGGKKEFVFIALAVDPTAKNPVGRIHIHVLSDTREELMRITLSDTLRMLEEGDLVEHTKVNLLWNGLHDFDRDGRKELYIVARNYILSPTAAHCITLEDRSAQTFAHYGHFNALRILDYNGDGRDELVFAGVHGDPLDRGIVCVLDPLHMQGTTPTNLDPSFIEFQNDAALLYIMFPRTVMCELLEGGCSRPHAMTINPEGGGVVWFGVQEGRTSLRYYFDDSWNCTRVEPITTYESLYRALRKTHDLRTLEEYMEELCGKVRYWDKDRHYWVAAPP
ncbi:MAG TPA: VCBS repeat-containing protein [Candidatus Eisenbacteria bacterium]|uniref:VCBS repeat-containing protein n=1 Tax=Eiseniibacteriota bacterium TaxID=2212470 RepID=A0A7V2AUB8_UNCEI|nr:VCBS repeat-containing protein [Candidatus Eisenbacteria bacterium]